ncbi:hypothetical protein K449DRAFT_215304 [Hypoxylon sp. EC38]|nr:hypothetical protein K449DRAFT_215304 [Hypoxylon sp. EC38]
MVHEDHHDRSTGSDGRKGSNANRQHNSGSNNNGSVLSRVLGSFRQKHQEDKKISSQSKGQQEDWITNYKRTHHPDRPLVDKRTRTILPDDEYADRIERMQERNQRYYGLNDRSPTSPPLQANVPNFSYSSTSVKGMKGSPLSPDFPRTGWQSVDGALSTSRDRTLRSPVSPKIVPILSSPEGDLGRGRIVRHIARTRPEYLLPKKIYDGDESSAESSPRESLHEKERSSADFPEAETVRREPRSPVHSYINSSPPSLIRDSSLASSLISQEIATPVTPVDQSSNPNFAPQEPPRTCPWAGCDAILITEQEKTDNLCADCHEALYPRQSAFFGSDDKPKPEVDEAQLEALHALLGTRIDVAKDVHVDEIRGRTARLVSSRFTMNGFKLQPAPPGKNRRPALGPRQNEANRGGFARQISPSTSAYGNHIGFQDARWFPSPQLQKTPNTKPRPKAKAAEEPSRELPGSQYSISSQDSNDSDSWTTDPYTTESSSDNDRALHHREPGPKNKDTGAIANIASTSRNEKQGNKGNPKPGLQPARREKHHRPSRDTVLYREIEEIIDCYITADDMDAEYNERRKADAIASYYEKEPEAVEMRRKGFI